MTAQIDLSTTLSALTKILTVQFNVLNNETSTNPPPPILSLIGATIFCFRSLFPVPLRVIITTPSQSDSKPDADSDSETQTSPPQPQSNNTSIIWEFPAPARFSPAEADELMKTLEKLHVSSLEQDAKECDICKKEFSPLLDAASSTDPILTNSTQAPNEYSADDEEPENPVRLVCGHIYGENCLKRWISRSGGGDLPTCPMCRAVIEKGNIAVSEIKIILDRVGTLHCSQ